MMLRKVRVSALEVNSTICCPCALQLTYPYCKHASPLIRRCSRRDNKQTLPTVVSVCPAVLIRRKRWGLCLYVYLHMGNETIDRHTQTLLTAVLCCKCC